MRTLTKFVAWLIGYYYGECEVCRRFYAILGDGRIVGWCDKRRHSSEPQEAR